MNLSFLGFCEAYRCEVCGSRDGLRGHPRGPYYCREHAPAEPPWWLVPPVWLAIGAGLVVRGCGS